MMPRKLTNPGAEKAVRDIRRATRRRYSAEEKIRIVLEGLRGGGQYRRAVPQRGPQCQRLLRWSKESL